MTVLFVDKLRQAAAFVQGFITGKRGPKLTRVQIEVRQSKLFKSLKMDVLAKTVFYRNMRERGLSDFPVLDKPQLLENFAHINSVGLTRDACEKIALQAELSRDFSSSINGVSVGLSSGTSGQRGMFLTNAQERAEWAGYIIAKNLTFTLRKQRVALLLRSNNALYEASQGVLLQFQFFDLTLPFETITQGLEQYDPDVLIAPAQVLGKIAREKVSIKPQKIISGAEVLEDEIRVQIESEYRIKVDEIYQCTEGYIASTCEQGNLHLNEDIMIIEKQWIDEASGRFMPIITDLRRTSLPLVRFRLDDILQLQNEPCPCGSQMQRLAKIEGRRDDSLWLRQCDAWQSVFPDLIRRSMMCATDITDYRIEQWGDRWQISLESEAMERAKQSVTSVLADLAKSQSARLPLLEFKEGIMQSQLEKCRRVTCKQAPAGLVINTPEEINSP